MKTLFILILLTITFSLDAQIAINSDNSDADPSAMFDIKSTDKGILIPRMTTSQRNAIISPSIGLIVFTTNNETFWFRHNSGWIALKNGNLNELADNDNDTKIIVEESNNEDMIRFNICGTEHFRMEEGRFFFPNNGRSIFIGVGAGENDQFSGNFNVFIGNDAGKANLYGRYNTALGKYSFSQNIDGNYNTTLGLESMESNISGYHNVASGWNSLNKNTEGDNNIALGNSSLKFNTTGNNNIGIGYMAGRENQVNSGNIFIGIKAGFQNYGVNNVMIGANAGANTSNWSGERNVFFGYGAGIEETSSDRLYIENSTSASPLIYGEFNNDLLRINGTFNINNAYTFPTSDGISGQVLQTDGSGAVSWTSPVTITTGVIGMYPNNTPPAGWLICDGSTFNQATYPDLHALLGSNILPDFSGRMPLGVGVSGTAGSTNHILNSTGGEEMHTLTIDEMPAHSHDIIYREGTEQGSGLDYSDLGDIGVNGQTQPTGGGQVHNNMSPYYTLYFIIRAK